MSLDVGDVERTPVITFDSQMRIRINGRLATAAQIAELDAAQAMTPETYETRPTLPLQNEPPSLPRPQSIESRTDSAIWS